ncbi:MAG: hypothetical protein V1797_03670 [Pseudomonadota bacterium]
MAILTLGAHELRGHAQAQTLLRAWPFLADDGAEPAERRASVLLAGLKDAARVLALTGGGADGAWRWLAAWEPLAFDSQVFGRPLGRIDLLAHAAAWPEAGALADGCEILSAACASAWAAGLEGLSLRLPARDLLAAQAAEAAGFRLVDVSVEWELDLAAGPKPAAPPAGLGLRPAGEADADALMDLAARSFCDLESYGDRFALDPRLRPGCPELYRRWMANSIAGDQADQVLVLAGAGPAADAAGLVGFMTLKNPPAGAADGRGWVVLNAVDPARRGRGLYNLLLAHGLAGLAAAGATRARVRTKVSQLAVIRAWSRLGARQAGAWLTLHAWRDGAADIKACEENT